MQLVIGVYVLCYNIILVWQLLTIMYMLSLSLCTLSVLHALTSNVVDVIAQPAARLQLVESDSLLPNLKLTHLDTESCLEGRSASTVTIS